MIWINIMTIVTSAVITALMGLWVIPAMKKLHFGQTILDIGPAWHKETKQGTPTMGGIMFIIGSALAFTVGLIIAVCTGQAKMGTETYTAISGMIMAVCFGFIGFLDDLIKVKKKQNEGLTATQKMFFQVLVIAAYFTTRIFMGNTSTTITFPGLFQLDLSFFYYIVMGLGMIYLVNAVNLSDGIDGLCGSITFVYMTVFSIICTILSFFQLELFAVAIGGGCIGFLIWNFHPAKVFMGDTGSMFLGGAVIAVGIGAGVEVIMVIACGVYIWEALTVLIQMTYFKLTHGKRLFKMTPIHHSFEKRGWSENKIVVLFSVMAAAFGAAGIFLTTLL